MSEINGCVPLFVSRTLVGTLDMIVTRDIRVMVVGDAKHPLIQAAQPEITSVRDQASVGRRQHEDVSVSIGSLPQRTMNVPLLRNHHALSEREVRILDGLVKGHANKVIARTCEITEATVKVHMQSILRKIRVTNRTQAAIWTMENGYATDGSSSRRLNPNSARNAAAITEAAIRSVALNRGACSSDVRG